MHRIVVLGLTGVTNSSTMTEGGTSVGTGSPAMTDHVSMCTVMLPKHVLSEHTDKRAMPGDKARGEGRGRPVGSTAQCLITWVPASFHGVLMLPGSITL